MPTHIPMHKKTPLKFILLLGLMIFAGFKIDFAGGMTMGYLVFFVLFFALFVWLERRSRELIKLALPNGIEARKFIDDLCEENSWEIIDASQGTFKVLVDETSFGSWGEVITLIESEDGLLVNSSSKDGGLVTLGKDKKNIEKVKTFTNNHYKKEV